MRNTFIERIESSVKVVVEGKNVNNYIKRLIKDKVEIINLKYLDYNKVEIIIKWGYYMKILDKLNNYINENEYKIIITDSYINIINYKEILDFNSTRISVRHNKGITIISGIDLVVSKMVEDEILITGKFTAISLKGET